MKKREFHIYTDGACRVNTDKLGAWAFVIIDPDDNQIIHEDSGVVERTTSSTMELVAAFQALGYAWDELPQGRVVLHSDSQFVIQGTSIWVDNWERQHWRTSSGKKVKHKELWKDLSDINKIVGPELKWVRGHNGNEWNEYVDKMCTEISNKTKTKNINYART